MPSRAASINVEFISANPTGPLHLGHTRWAAVGDALARVLEAAGAEVAREFYINDRGRQMDLFGASVEATALGEPVPEDGYQGGYIADLAREVAAADPDITELPDGERLAAFRDAAYAVQLADQRAQLESFRTRFDVWFSERSLHQSQSVAENIEKLRGEGHLYDADGALWMRTTDAGDDRDRVLIRTNGVRIIWTLPTSVAPRRHGRTTGRRPGRSSSPSRLPRTREDWPASTRYAAPTRSI